ncbi:MAG TPA: glycoside hydrolase family 2 TIM barrel-domain containing protein [Solirubrobacteraceae bacterium]
MQLLSLVLTAAFGAPAPADAPATYAGPDGRSALRAWTFDGRAVTIPHVANAALPGTRAAYAAFRGARGTYRTTVRTEPGTYVLRFESVAARAEVEVDGHRVAAHQRAYEPFEARMQLDGGEHEVVVRADWRSPAAQTRLGLHRTWFNWGGINREVTLRRVDDSEITGVALTTRVRGDSARVALAVRVQNNLDVARPVPVLARLVRRGRARLYDLGTVELGPGEARTLERTVVVPRPDLWRPGLGALYQLQVVVPFESGYRARVGLRELSWRGGVLRVNGRPTVLRGASLHEDVPQRGDALTIADMRDAVRQLRAIGANATRAQHPLAPALLERLDRAGIAVWQQIGPVDSPGKWRARTPALLAQAREDVREDLRAGRLHPAIVAWSLGCEVAGNGEPGQGAFVDAAARELHAADPDRAVAVDVWTDHVPAVPGLLYRSLDAVGVTSYIGWYEQPRAPMRAQAALLRERVSALRARFPGKAVVVAELGAEGTPDSPAARPGGRAYQARLLGAQLGGLRNATGLSGVFVWVLRDFAVNPAFRGGTATRVFPSYRAVSGLNQKGLFDYAGRAKPAAAAVRRAFTRP